MKREKNCVIHFSSFRKKPKREKTRSSHNSVRSQKDNKRSKFCDNNSSLI